MVAPAVEGIDLFKIAGRSISGWIPSFKMGAVSHVRQPFCSQLEEVESRLAGNPIKTARRAKSRSCADYVASSRCWPLKPPSLTMRLNSRDFPLSLPLCYTAGNLRGSYEWMSATAS